ncbi:radical SAM protein [Komagataeibacter kakiaceti JCM 25156]|uniref:B12-binding domain-containing radical SAM protein n=1 Tax=Komagataeibacter kakiaceti TaxID=943261 RepID=UPI000472DF1B|nr:radical SAM protein [Komagataeibacter kakiaceti]
MSKTDLKLLIIQPSHYRSKTDRTIFKTRRRQMVPLALPYLAALTPPEWTVTLLDEQLEDIDFDTPVDVVALSAWTLHSPRAYDIAAEFRRRGVKVIMGGPHVFFYADEAAEHCDAVGVGEAEPIWRTMLEDAAAGRLQKIYRAAPLKELNNLPPPRYDLLDLKKFGPFRTFAVQSSRGCPFVCDFCSERFYLGGRFRWRPVDQMVSELERIKNKSSHFFFGESNFGGKKSRAMELMEGLVPLKIRWSTLWSSNLCLDTEFLDLARRSGVMHVNIGIESIDAEMLQDMKKGWNKASRYGEMFENLRKRDISYSLNFIFGFDNEHPDVYDATLTFLEAHKVPAAYFNILTPTKGTALFERMKKAGRIIDPDDIDRWPGQVCHIFPKNCTPGQMEERIQGMYRRFYSMRSMVHRLPFPRTRSEMATWILNMTERRMAFSSTGNNDFDIY